MHAALARWQATLTRQTGLGPATVVEYVRDARAFLAWLTSVGWDGDVVGLTAQEARDYRDHLVRLGRAPATVNRALVSLALFLDAAGRRDDNPIRRIDRVDVVAQAPKALAPEGWRAVRQAAARQVARDRGLALALVCLLRFAGPRVGEVAALQPPDLQLFARRGTLIIRRGKGLKHRQVPLVLEAREPLEDYFRARRDGAERWQRQARLTGQPAPAWSTWPDGHCFLGQRGPLTERGIREIVAKLGVAAKLEAPLYPHALRHTFAKALLDPAAYGLDRPAAPITAVQELLGHAAIATTALYTRATPADLARLMGEPAE